MADKKIGFKITADGSAAQKSVKKLGNVTKKTFGSMKKGLKGFGTAMTGINMALEVGAKAFGALDAIAKKFVSTGKDLNRAKFFKVTQKQADDFNNSLGNSLTKMEALRELTSLKGGGFGMFQSKQIAEMSRAISLMTQMTRQQAFEMLKNGEVNQQVLTRFQLGASIVENAFKKANRTITDLTAAEKSQIVMKVLTQRAKELGRNISELAKKDVVSPFLKLRNVLSNVVDSVGRKLVPLFTEMVKSFGGVDKLSEKIFDTIKEWIPTIKTIKKELVNFREKGWLIWGLEKAGGELQKAAERIGQIIAGWMGVSFGKVFSAKLKEEIDLNAIDKILKNLPGDKKIPLIEPDIQPLPPLKGGKNKNNFKRRTRSQQELFDELSGFQSEARALSRNFFSTFLDALSNLGGTISGVFASLKDLPERLRVFGAEPETQKGLLKFFKTAKSLDALSSQGLITSLKRLKVEHQKGEISTKQVAAISNILLLQRSGLTDQQEFLNAAKAATIELKNRLNPLQSAAKLAEIATIQRDKAVDIDASNTHLMMLRVGLQVKMNALAKKRFKDTTSPEYKLQQLQLGLFQKQLERVNQYRQEYTKLAKEQKTSLNAIKNIAEMEKVLEIMAIKRAANEQVKSIDRERIAANMELLSLQNKMSPLKRLELQASQKLADIENRKSSIQRKVNEILVRRNIAIEAGNLNAVTGFDLQLKGLQKILGALDKYKKKTQEVTEEQKKQALAQTGFMGGLKSHFAQNILMAKEATKDMSKAFGQTAGQAISQFTDFALGMTKRLGASLFKALSGSVDDAFGKDATKSAFEFLASLSETFAKFFATLGTGMLFLPGYKSWGIGLLAASAALGVLAGVFSGAAGGAETTPTTTASTNAATMVTSMGSETRERRDTQEIIVVLNSMPWNGDEKQQARRFRDFLKKNRRTVGSLI